MQVSSIIVIKKTVYLQTLIKHFSINTVGISLVSVKLNMKVFSIIYMTRMKGNEYRDG